MKYAVLLSLLCGAALPSPSTRAQSGDSAAIPEMARLAKVLAGDWNTLKSCNMGSLSLKAQAAAGPRTSP